MRFVRIIRIERGEVTVNIPFVTDINAAKKPLQLLALSIHFAESVTDDIVIGIDDAQGGEYDAVVRTLEMPDGGDTDIHAALKDDQIYLGDGDELRVSCDAGVVGYCRAVWEELQ